MNNRPLLLIVYHSQSGNTDRLSAAVEEGARKVLDVRVERKKAAQVTAADIEQCRMLVVCSPEYFGYMAGAVKDLFDRTYEAVRQRIRGKPYALVICAGNDGTGALNSIERILKGCGVRRVQEPLISRGPVSEEILRKCRELGETLAAGIELGIY
ncbi:MAG: NAD(P)H-dependent oxidoreductase [Thermodesulfobacteriota bacterium]